MATRGWEDVKPSDVHRKNALVTSRITGAKPSKYRAVKTTVDGIVFDSAKEARRYSELKMLLRAGEIEDLERQPELTVSIKGVWICDYLADFKYRRRGDIVTVWEDVKGMKTPVYRLKKKLVEALYGITITEI